MKVETYLFGSVEVNPESIINFPSGLVGFESSKRFMLVHEEDEHGGAASFTLQSVDDPAFAVQIIDPTTLGFNYELALSDSENAVLASPTAEDVAVMLVVSRQAEGEAAAVSANIRAPLVINTRARVGLQKVMQNIRPNITLSNLVNEI